MTLLSARGIRAGFEARGGFIRGLTVVDQGRQVAPLHRVPWVGETLAPETPAHLRAMEGDFFCAPFAQEDEGAAMHGWPANSLWRIEDGAPFRAVLSHPVRGALLLKCLTLQDDHPFLYQRHVFVGGTGIISAANHAMVSLPNGGLIRTSTKAYFETCGGPPEADPARGRSALAYPARAENPRAFPTAQGGIVDLTRYPFVPGNEDFVVGVEAPGHDFGWTAVTRPAEGDLFLSLRNARILPMSMFWHSDGGRDYSPWNGRHRGCLGVEEGLAPHMLGVGPPPGMAPGFALHPHGTVELRHVIGAIAWPTGEAVAQVTRGAGQVTVKGEAGTTRVLPFDDGFLELTDAA